MVLIVNQIPVGLSLNAENRDEERFCQCKVSCIQDNF